LKHLATVDDVGRPHRHQKRLLAYPIRHRQQTQLRRRLILKLRCDDHVGAFDRDSVATPPAMLLALYGHRASNGG
jgi:hypothetical protein